jgi:neuronal guanine nucleotide exchange factor
MRSELDSDGYEEIGDGSQKQRYSRPTAMELIQPREGQHRTLWCEIPEVVNSRVLSKTIYVSIIVLEGKSY